MRCTTNRKLPGLLVYPKLELMYCHATLMGASQALAMLFSLGSGSWNVYLVAAVSMVYVVLFVVRSITERRRPAFAVGRRLLPPPPQQHQQQLNTVSLPLRVQCHYVYDESHSYQDQKVAFVPCSYFAAASATTSPRNHRPATPPPQMRHQFTADGTTFSNTTINATTTTTTLRALLPLLQLYIALLLLRIAYHAPELGQEYHAGLNPTVAKKMKADSKGRRALFAFVFKRQHGWWGDPLFK